MKTASLCMSRSLFIEQMATKRKREEVDAKVAGIEPVQVKHAMTLENPPIEEDHHTEFLKWVSDMSNCPTCYEPIFGAVSNGVCWHIICLECAKKIPCTADGKRLCPLCRRPGEYRSCVFAEVMLDRFTRKHVSHMRRVARLLGDAKVKAVMHRCTSSDVVMFMDWLATIGKAVASDQKDIRRLATYCLKPDARRKMITDRIHSFQHVEFGLLMDSALVLEFDTHAQRAAVLTLEFEGDCKMTILALLDRTGKEEFVRDEFKVKGFDIRIKETW